MHPISAIDLSIKELLNQAQENAQLHDWGDITFLKNLEVLLHSFETESKAHIFGRSVFHSKILRLLQNRLYIANILRQHPEISAIPIESPLFIIGMPRTGTTYLHKMLASDTKFHHLKLWQGLYPASLSESETTTESFIQENYTLMKNLSSIHPLGAFEPEECFLLMEHTFNDMIFEFSMHIPTYSNYIEKHADNTYPYRYHRNLLQLLHFNQPCKSWLLKAPRHLSTMGNLLKVYPNARFIFLHRDPAKAIPSMCNLSFTLHQIYTDDIAKNELGKRTVNKMLQSTARADAIRSSIDPKNIIDIKYTDLVKSPMANMYKLYEHFNLPFTHTAQQKITAYIELNKKSKLIPHIYTAEAYGLTSDNLRAMFSQYMDRYDIPKED